MTSTNSTIAAAPTMTASGSGPPGGLDDDEHRRDQRSDGDHQDAHRRQS